MRIISAFLCCVLCLQGQGQLAMLTSQKISVPALVQSAKQDNAGGSTTVVKAYGSNITAGNLEVIVFGFGLDASLTGTPTQTVSSVVSSLGTTLTLDKCQLTTGANGSRECFYSGVATSSGADTITVTFSASAWYATMHVMEWSGIQHGVWLDQTGQSAPTATTSPSLSSAGAPVQKGEVIIAFIGFGGVAITGVSTGYTNIQRTFSLSSDYIIGTALSTETMNWGTATNTTNSNCIMVTYKHA